MNTHTPWKYKTAALAVITLCLLISAPALQAAPETSGQTELNADEITYTAKTGVMAARGGVRLTQGTTVITGNSSEYNVRTKQAVVTGNVRVVRDGNTLTAAEVRSFNDMARFVATGNALLTHRDGTAAGPRLEYLPPSQYASITGGARLTGRDAVITARAVEAFLNENRAIAEGDVHIVSEGRNLDAVSDHAVYYGAQSMAELTGNVRAVQNGAVLTGNHVTLYLDDSAINADGRAKLVIQPKPAAPSETKTTDKGVR